MHWEEETIWKDWGFCFSFYLNWWLRHFCNLHFLWDICLICRILVQLCCPKPLKLLLSSSKNQLPDFHLSVTCSDTSACKCHCNLQTEIPAVILHEELSKLNLSWMCIIRPGKDMHKVRSVLRTPLNQSLHLTEFQKTVLKPWSKLENDGCKSR